ncbi:GNAT family N-acetyltransferase [Cupriavidus lacunae]|uniref:GNAT family N-acetyltransferase n=1 Tax=Cupriavidus lacunae TaxID=2666307 RepID=UPI001FC9067F|nr:GNAT family N-acetyltransferase [Cupriavidus lacunae]
MTAGMTCEEGNMIAFNIIRCAPQALLAEEAARRSHIIMLTDVVLRSAFRSDWHHIAALLEQCGLPTSDTSEIVEDFQVALYENRIIGCAAAEHHGSSVLIRSVAVEPAYRDRGIAGCLVEALLMRARGTEAHEAYIFSTVAPAYFARWGFSLVETEDVPLEVMSSPAVQRAALTSALCMRCELK